jgi:hypothetical protein
VGTKGNQMNGRNVLTEFGGRRKDKKRIVSKQRRAKERREIQPRAGLMLMAACVPSKLDVSVQIWQPAPTLMPLAGGGDFAL